MKRSVVVKPRRHLQQEHEIQPHLPVLEIAVAIFRNRAGGGNDVAHPGEHVPEVFRAADLVEPAFQLGQFEEKADAEAGVVAGVLVQVARFENAPAQRRHRPLNLGGAHRRVFGKSAGQAVRRQRVGQGDIAVEERIIHLALIEKPRDAFACLLLRLLAPLAGQRPGLMEPPGQQPERSADVEIVIHLLAEKPVVQAEREVPVTRLA